MPQDEKYKVIKKLDSGGMAEVFLGEAEGIQGFKKQVAIKRILPELVENKQFLTMFLDEAKLSLSLNHANVAQVFDIGRSGDTYFIVMEYVDGINLKKTMKILSKRDEPMPVEQAVFIVVEVCRGLAYAHAKKRHDGENMNIVHRDISPPNVLLSKQGEVKILDFGLAKATDQLERTDPGVVKGKFAYLAPETAWGRPIDHRVDIFACGIILFELLTNERLFLGESDLDTIKLVREGKVPSISKINQKVPRSLEEIVNKALQQDPEKRYQKCDEFAETLSGFLFEYGKKVTSFDLQRFVKKISEEITEPKPKPSIIDQLIQEELGAFSSIGDDSQADSTADEDEKDPTGASPLDPSHFNTGEFPAQPYDSFSQINSNNSTMQPGNAKGASLKEKNENFSNPLNHASLFHMLEGKDGQNLSDGTKNSKMWIIYFIAIFLGLASITTIIIFVAFFLDWV